MVKERDETLNDQKISEDEDCMKDKQLEAEKFASIDENLKEKDTSQEKNLTGEGEQAKAKAEEYYNQLQRLQADFDNYRKRTQKEKAEIIKYATERLVKDLLPVLDNFERAVEAAKTNPDFTSFSQGVDMILRQVQDVLGKEGLKPMEVVGRPFDPNLHEAVHRVDSEEYAENIIVEELQKGYFLKEKVLRPGMVTVSN